MASHQEAAFEKLNRWLQSESRTLKKENPEVNDSLKRAVRALKQRPILLQSCLEELTSVRQQYIANFFISALTKGGPNGTPKPIELSAHDPIRYISDMLAWVHQTCAYEKELLEQLLDKLADSPVNSRLSASRRISTTDRISVLENSELTDNEELNALKLQIAEESLLSQLINRNVSGVIRPLRVPLECLTSSFELSRVYIQF
jgi:hypothetical protein